MRNFKYIFTTIALFVLTVPTYAEPGNSITECPNKYSDDFYKDLTLLATRYRYEGQMILCIYADLSGKSRRQPIGYVYKPCTQPKIGENGWYDRSPGKELSCASVEGKYICKFECSSPTN